MEQVFEQFKNLSEMEQHEFMKQASDYFDRENRNHIPGDAFGFKDRIQEMELTIVSMSNTIDELESK